MVMLSKPPMASIPRFLAQAFVEYSGPRFHLTFHYSPCHLQEVIKNHVRTIFHSKRALFGTGTVLTMLLRIPDVKKLMLKWPTGVAPHIAGVCRFVGRRCSPMGVISQKEEPLSSTLVVILPLL
ncbi:hypothetical protein FRC02_001031 [Tulasnella sp. 418]|nr:hypothetical protein FRC02_001031 [Tulasnella sp. 418]